MESSRVGKGRNPDIKKKCLNVSDGDEPSLDLVSDPKYRGLCDDAVYTVFGETPLAFVTTGRRKAFRKPGSSSHFGGAVIGFVCSGKMCQRRLHLQPTLLS